MSLIEKSLQELFPSNDPLDSLEFDPVSYINSIFPTEQSLSKIENVKLELQNNANSVAKELSEIVKSQAKIGEKAMKNWKETHKELKL